MNLAEHVDRFVVAEVFGPQLLDRQQLLDGGLRFGRIVQGRVRVGTGDDVVELGLQMFAGVLGVRLGFRIAGERGVELATGLVGVAEPQFGAAVTPVDRGDIVGLNHLRLTNGLLHVDLVPGHVGDRAGHRLPVTLLDDGVEGEQRGAGENGHRGDGPSLTCHGSCS